MGFPTRCAILALGIVLTARSGIPAQSDQEPRYDPSATVSMRVIVAEVKEAAKGSPLPGIHLLVRTETGRADSELLDVYAGPADFLKQMEMTFRPYDRIDVIGSKVRLGGSHVILARELRRNTSTLYIRDEKGEPVWKLLLK